MDERDTAAPETQPEEAEEQTAQTATDTPTAEPAAGEGTPDPAAQGADDKGDEQTGDDKPNKSRAQKRIETLVTKNHRQAEEISRLRRRAEEAEKRLTEMKPPKEEDFEDHDAYQEAKINHTVSQKVLQTQREQATADMAEIESQRVAERQKAFAEGMAAFKQATPDFDAVVDAAKVPLTNDMAGAIIESPEGPAILYHLSQNPGLAEELRQMPTLTMVRELGRLEKTLEGIHRQPVQKPTTNAPPPVKPLPSGGSPVSVDPEKMTTAQYIAYRRKQLQGGK
ncbi:MAG: hypothetical protein OEV92_03940 [Nitrospinota bacterium]|nr:hypothetical protein [Nitrospinota bacterium]